MALSSNCNFKDVSVSESEKDDDGFEYEHGGYLEFQQAYLLPKNMQTLGTANKDLYMASLQATSYVITSTYKEQGYTKSIIAANKKTLGKYIDNYGWHVDKKGNEVSCKVS